MQERWLPHYEAQGDANITADLFNVVCYEIADKRALEPLRGKWFPNRTTNTDSSVGADIQYLLKADADKEKEQFQ